MYSEDQHRLDTPPPASQFRRPWSPDPYDPLPVARSLDADDVAPRPHQYFQQRRGPSDVSVEALDLADYAMALRPHQPAYFAQEALRRDQDIYTPSPRRVRPLSSRDSLQPPSLVSRGGTTSSQSHALSSSSRPPLRRPFSLPTPTHSADSRSHNPYIAHPTPPPGSEPEIDISQFPVWSRNWYKNQPGNRSSLDTLSTPYLDQAKRSPFDPGYNHSDPSDLHYSDPYALSSRDILPWTNDPPAYGPALDAETKQERLRMLEREFGAKAKAHEGMDADGKPIVGSVDSRGKLVTEGPKKRIATRAVQILLALAAAIPSIYAALIIKPSSPPPPQSKLPAFVLYILSILTFLALFYLFCIHPCCCGGKRAKPEGPMAQGMMVLPVQGLAGGKGGKKSKGKKGKKGGVGGQGDVQVNLIVDPGMFGARGEDGDSGEEEEEEELEYGGSVPGGFESRRRARRRRPRRSVFAGLALEEQWQSARGWLKKIAAFDVAGVVIWGAAFVLILMGKRCPSGQFDGWCNAYNVSSAAACLLCLSFGLSIFFDVKDLHASKLSPRTRT